MITAQIYSKADTGSYWTTLAIGTTEQRCLDDLARFLKFQPLHHFGIEEGRVIHLHSQDEGFYKRLAYSKLMQL